jgi:hypothetical protein
MRPDVIARFKARRELTRAIENGSVGFGGVELVSVGAVLVASALFLSALGR